jgi:serine/threonine protein phosphatase PrpC
MLIDACYVSSAGKVRRNNEDGILLNDTLVVMGGMRAVGSLSSRGDRLAYLVADGMGGHARGEAASSTVLTAFKEGYKDVDKEDHIRDLIRKAKEALNLLADKEQGSVGLGTTVAGIFFSGGKAFLLNCGDSRVYQSDGSLKKITKDHSLVQELADSGTITEEEMRIHPQKNIITSALMGDLRTGLPLYSLEEIEIRKGRRFLLCSDGLWESLSYREMAECLNGKGIKEGAECLFQRTLDAGAADNVSIILLEVAEV